MRKQIPDYFATLNVSERVTSLIVRTVDSDVLILLVSFTFRFILEKGCDNCVHFGSGEKPCFYYINGWLMKYGEQRSNALPFLFTFTGCDTLSSFFNHGKYKLWDCCSTFEDYDTLTDLFDCCSTFEDYDALTDLFEELSTTALNVNDEQLRIIESFVLFVYNGKQT